MDSIMGCKGSRKTLLVLTERRTRMGIVILLEDHTAARVYTGRNTPDIQSIQTGDTKMGEAAERNGRFGKKELHRNFRKIDPEN